MSKKTSFHCIDMDLKEEVIDEYNWPWYLYDSIMGNYDNTCFILEKASHEFYRDS